MRILHFSDVHIGVESYGRTDPETGLSTRLLDFLHVFDEVVDYALSEKVDLVLFCGDAYKSRDPTQTHQREFARRIARLASGGIPVFLLTGNHDMPHVTSRATALEIFRTLDVRNVHIADRLDTYRVPTNDGPLQIVALPWVRRGGLLASEEGKGLTPKGVDRVIQERLTQAIHAQAETLDGGIPAIFAGHVSVSEAKTSSEQSMLLGQEHVLLKSSVARPEFDYVALGHIHRHQVLGNDPLVVYPGSLERVDFGEEGEEKGFCMVDLDPSMPRGLRRQSFEFRPVQARNFLTISIDLPPGELDPTTTAINAVQAYHFQDAIVRVQLRLKEQDGRLRESDVRRALDGAHFVASISRQVEQDVRPRLGTAHAENLQPLDALKAYLQTRDTDPTRAELLMRHARKLVNEDAG